MSYITSPPFNPNATALFQPTIKEVYIFSMATTNVLSLSDESRFNPPYTGIRAMVVDALAPVFGQPVVGDGGVTVPVYWDGGAWCVG